MDRALAVRDLTALSLAVQDGTELTVAEQLSLALHDEAYWRLRCARAEARLLMLHPGLKVTG